MSIVCHIVHTDRAVAVFVVMCFELHTLVEHVWNVMAHAQRPDLVFQRNRRVHLNRRGIQFSRLLAVEECGSAGRPWIDHVPRHSARVATTLFNRLFPRRFPSHASPCAITFWTASTSSFIFIWRRFRCLYSSMVLPTNRDRRREHMSHAGSVRQGHIARYLEC